MSIKNIVLATASVLTFTLAVEAGTPPTVMFLPDKTWCTQNKFVTVSERNGKKRYNENYEEAFIKNSDLKNVVTQLNALLGDNGIKALDFMAQSEADDEEEAELEMYEGEEGDEVGMTAYEQALNKLRPDIIIKVGWDLNKVGFNQTASYRLEAIDSYTSKAIASVTAETPSAKTTVPVAALIKNAANEHMPLFISRMQEHFDDLQKNGREITLLCQVSGGSDVNMNTFFGDKKLSEIISDYVHNNTVNHAYNVRGTGRNRIQFNQVRIPFTDASGKRLQAGEFADGLQKHLMSYGITSENGTKGLGGGRLLDIKGQ